MGVHRRSCHAVPGKEVKRRRLSANCRGLEQESVNKSCRLAAAVSSGSYDLPPSHRYGATGPTNKHFTLNEWSSSDIDWRSVSPKGQRCSADQNPLKRSDLDDFVACYNPKNRHERKESERFKSFTYEELTKRDKLNLDIFWLKDESLEDSANLRDPRHHRRRNR